jgi:hypothetical protein
MFAGLRPGLPLDLSERAVDSFISWPLPAPGAARPAVTLQSPGIDEKATGFAGCAEALEPDRYAKTLKARAHPRAEDHYSRCGVGSYNSRARYARTQGFHPSRLKGRGGMH